MGEWERGEKKVNSGNVERCCYSVSFSRRKKNAMIEKKYLKCKPKIKLEILEEFLLQYLSAY